MIEYLDLEKLINGRITFLLLLQFVKEHDNRIIYRLKKPEIWNSNKYLNLNKNTIYRLNILENNSIENTSSVNSLYHILDKTSTSMGKRLLKWQLLNPITNQEELIKRYNRIDYFYNNSEKLCIIEKQLNKIIDLERVHRKLSLKTLKKDEFFSLNISYDCIQNILNELDEKKSNELDKYSLSNRDIEKYKEFQTNYKTKIDISKIVNKDINIFHHGIYTEVDVIETQMNHINNFFKKLCIILSVYIEHEIEKTSKSKGKIFKNNGKLVDYEYVDKEGAYRIIMTDIRAQKLKANIQRNKQKEEYIKLVVDEEEYKIPFLDISFKSCKSGKNKIECNLIHNMSEKLYRYTEKLKKKVDYFFLELIESYHEYMPMLNNISNFVSELDVAKSNGKSAFNYRYNKPMINTNNSKSFIDIKGIRHPIIERILTDVEYKTNDIILGKDKDTNNENINNNINNENNIQDGILLFGTNSCGKSSLMKAIGLNIVMAQAGMYVPCSTMEYLPYTQIFSRIGNQDNIFTGKSSYTQEMYELRDIMKRVDKHSLVIGDELCSGTEYISALSVVSAGIITLSQTECSFIFATHLHRLREITEIEELDNVNKYHLKVYYDYEKKCLIYDRKLTHGYGEEEYGLEVAKSLHLEDEFIKKAYEIRNHLVNDSIKLSKSHYNHDKYIGNCELCGDIGVDVHHIKFQSEADENGFINQIHKNVKSNLCILCESCHNKVHHGNLEIKGYIETSEGIQLDSKEIHKKKSPTSKFTEEHIEFVKTQKQKKLTNMQIQTVFENEFNISISTGTISNLLKK